MQHGWPCLQRPPLYKLSWCICSTLPLCAGAWMEAQLVFLRDEEEAVSPLLSDTTDDWNINGLRRAEQQHTEEVAQQH